MHTLNFFKWIIFMSPILLSLATAVWASIVYGPLLHSPNEKLPAFCAFVMLVWFWLGPTLAILLLLDELWGWLIVHALFSFSLMVILYRKQKA